MPAHKQTPTSTRLLNRAKDILRIFRFNLLRSEKDPEKIFTNIFRRNAWGSRESVSGMGSDEIQTRAVVKSISDLLDELGIRKILDVPCGDFNWMKNVNLRDIEYLGGDIVSDLISRNKSSHETETVRFRQINLLTDPLPVADLILCRDCLVHLSFDHILKSLMNIAAGSSEYLLTTTFPSRSRNYDIPTGQWRTLNLQIEPFNLPPPRRMIHEGCTEHGGAFSDKALGLWHIVDIRESLSAQGKRF
jgi:hypothetical protein